MNAVNLGAYYVDHSGVLLIIWRAIDVQDTALLFTKSLEPPLYLARCCGAVEVMSGLGSDWDTSEVVPLCPPFSRRNIWPEATLEQQAESSTHP